VRRSLLLGCLGPLLLLGCGDDTAVDLGAPDLSAADLNVLAGDSDHDGLTDDEELALAANYLPFLSGAPDDMCPVSGLVVRVTPIAPAPLVALRYAWLFDRRCDGVPVEGDGGAFVVFVDPRVPAPAGQISLRGNATPGSACQRFSTCGQCSGQPICATLGGEPAVWAARDRHAIYVDRPLSCTQVSPCEETCEDAPATAHPPIVDVGEPTAPTVRDLTDAGFVRPENGWTSPSLLHHDPWGGAPFGALPPIAELLTGASADAPVCLP
jgi:hypothetical protein